MKTKLKKSAAIVLSTFISVGTTAAYAKLPIGGESIISPYYIAISATNAELTEVSGGLNCFGKTKVKSGYTAYVKVELQQYGGQWTTVNTWTARASIQASVDRTVSPTGGHLYRLKVTHIAYNGNGSQVESDTSYSNEIYY